MLKVVPADQVGLGRLRTYHLPGLPQMLSRRLS